jgi:hypothetical protein
VKNVPTESQVALGKRYGRVGIKTLEAGHVDVFRLAVAE